MTCLAFFWMGAAAFAAESSGSEFDAFNTWFETYQTADSLEEKNVLTEAGIALAGERRSAMRSLMAVDPASALSVSFPASARQELPDVVRDLVEKEISGEGHLQVLVTYGTAPAEGDGNIIRRVQMAGESYRAYLISELAPARTARDLHIEGIALDHLLAVRSLTAGAMPVALSAEGSPLVFEEEEPIAMGEKRVLVMRGGFGAGVEPVAEQEGYDVMGEVHQFIQENSFRNLSFNLIHVTEEVVLLPGGEEDYLPQEADEEAGLPEVTIEEAMERLVADSMEAAAQEGYFNEYDLVLAVLPSFGLVGQLSGGDDSVGAALVSGPFSFLLVEGAAGFQPSRVSQLMAHNFGLWGSHYWKPLGPLADYPVAEGRWVNKGNPFDLMGGIATLPVWNQDVQVFDDMSRRDFHFPNNHLSGNFKNILGWLPDSNIHLISDEPSAALYRLFSLDHGASLREGRNYSMRLINETGPFPPWVDEEAEEAERLDYWIDFRRQPFSDGEGRAFDRLRNGVVIQWGDGGSMFGSNLINAHPDLWPVEDEEVALSIGETFNDPYFGLLVTPVQVGGVAPNEFIDLIVTRGTLEVDIIAPLPSPSGVNPEGIINVSLTQIVEFVIEAGATTSSLAGLEFWVSGELIAEIEVAEEDDSTFTFPFKFLSVGEGLHDVRVIARNEAGNSVSTEALLFSAAEAGVELNISPAVVQAGEEVLLTVLPVASNVEFDFVEFFINGVKIGTADTAPFEFAWTPDATGSFQVRALATDMDAREYWSGTWFVAVDDLGALVPLSWLPRTSGTTSDLEDIIFADGNFLTVGANGTILVSPDGIGWDTRDAGTSAHFRSVTQGAGKIVAVGAAGAIFSSEDSHLWTQRDGWTSGNLHSVTYGNGAFVAVGDNGRIRRSSDGETWAAALSGTTSELNAVIWGGELFVAVGGAGKIVTSPDGITWTSRDSGVTALLEGVSHGGNKFVAVGSRWDSAIGQFRAVVLLSFDGVEWIEADQTVESRMYSVHYGENSFAAAGAFGSTSFSRNGSAWTSQAPAVTVALQGIASANGYFVAVGHEGTILQSVETSFASWLTSRFSSDELSDPTIAGSEADPAGAGISNLMRYALGIDRHADPSEAMPKLSLVSDEIGRYLVLQYDRPSQLPDLNYIVERSLDLGSWEEIEEPGGSILIELEGPWERVTARDNYPIGEGWERRFLRLRVEPKE